MENNSILLDVSRCHMSGRPGNAPGHHNQHNARTIMTNQDKHILISHLAGALLVIAALVAAPFAWSALTSAQHKPIASATSGADLN
jgi:hypothetical protein